MSARKTEVENTEPRPAEDPAAPGREAEEAAGSSAASEALAADLDAMLAETQKERDEYLELAQRARADFENYRKRAAKEAQDAERRGRVRLAEGLVPALDNLERALLAAGIDPSPVDSESARAASQEVSAHEALAQGVALVYRELRAALERSGVESYDPAGEPFDPAWHEALSTRPHEDAKPGVVLETVDKGYRLDGQVLRPARVIVSA